MLVLVDTCGWIEWLTDGVLADQFGPWFDDPGSIIVPACLQYELYKWAKRERGEARALEAVALTEQGQVEPLTTSLALHAADLALAHDLSFANALIYTTARERNAELVTADDHFEQLAGVTYFPKRAKSL